MGTGKDKELLNETGKSGGQDSGSSPGKGGPNPGNTSTPGKPGGEGKGTEAKKQGIPGLVTIDIPAPPEEKKEKTSTKTSSKSSKGKATKAELKDLSSNIQVLLSTTFELVSQRAGEHWKISPEEAKGISDPLASIINRHDLSDSASEYGDYIALSLAVGITVIPRVIFHQELKPKGGKPIGADTARKNINPAAGSNQGSKPAPGGYDNVKELLSSMG